MQLCATKGKPEAAGWFSEDSLCDTNKVDVSTTAISLMYTSAVYMDAETFGVAVSRRPNACEKLTTEERSRLLDVLCHAQAFQWNCQTEPKAFQVWLIPSDAQDGKVRLTWFKIKKEEDSYLIELNDF